MAQAAPHSSHRSSPNWDLSEFNVHQRWRTRPPKEFPSSWAYDEYGLWQAKRQANLHNKTMNNCQ